MLSRAVCVEVGNLLNVLQGRGLNQNDFPWRPAVTMCDADEAYLLACEIPGVATEDVTVEVKNGVLAVAGKKKPVFEDVKARSECLYGSFERHFELPRNVDTESISATCADGLLRVTLPKKEALRPRKIEIATA